jgi:hypothetical protein
MGNCITIIYARFAVLMAVLINKVVMRDVKPCRLADAYK